MHKPTVIILSLLLTACTGHDGYRFPTSPVGQPSPTTLTLHEAFPIRPDRASEYIQYGEIKSYNRISEYYPHCIFELRTVADTERTVQPETFSVSHISRDRFMAGYRRLMVADDGGGDYNMVMSTTVLQLHSAQQPEVFRLSCQQLDEPYHARHVSLEQMRNALGKLFTIE